MKRSEIDRLGGRLRKGLSTEDLDLLNDYRREFRPAYEKVKAKLLAEFGIEIGGRPAKSTPAILDKLQRSSMRLSQMQDIAGCRIVVAGIVEQDQAHAKVDALFDVTVFDRRVRSSFGYRALHLVVREYDHPVEIQIRTSLQHAWAALSEKVADSFGGDLKYGGGPDKIRTSLNELSDTIAEFENDFERKVSEFSDQAGSSEILNHIAADWGKVSSDFKSAIDDKIQMVLTQLERRS